MVEQHSAITQADELGHHSNLRGLRGGTLSGIETDLKRGHAQSHFRNSRNVRKLCSTDKRHRVPASGLKEGGLQG